MALTQIKSAQILSLDPAKLSGEVPVNKGGTGAANAAAARTNLGLVIGANVQAYDAQLDTLAGLSANQIGALEDLATLEAPGSDGQIIVATGAGAFQYESGATARTSLGLAIGSNVQAHDAQLDDIAGLTPTDGNIIIGNGSNFILESGATARASLGLTIGTHVQAFHANLGAIAGLSTTADTMPFFTGTGSAALISFKDEDNMASNSATALASQQSIKAYVDSVAQGLDVKDSVKAATTGAGTLADDFANGDSIDGVPLATNDRILIKDQASASENGIYIVQASGAPSRALDFAAGEDAAGAFVFVEQGTANADNGFVCTTNKGSAVIGTNELAFSQFSGAGSITAGTGIAKSGSQLSTALNELSPFTTLASIDTVVMNDGGASGTNKQITMLNFASQFAMSNMGIAAQDGQIGIHAGALQATDVNLAEDSILIYDHAGGGEGSGDPKIESLADVMTAAAGVGLSATSGVLAVDLNEAGAGAVNVAADSILFIDADDNGTKKDTVADLMTASAGGGLVAAGGILSLDVETKVIEGGSGAKTTFDSVNVRRFNNSTLGSDTSNALGFAQVFVNGILQQGHIANDISGMGVDLAGTYDYLWDANGQLLYFNQSDIDTIDIVQVIYAK